MYEDKKKKQKEWIGGWPETAVTGVFSSSFPTWWLPVVSLNPYMLGRVHEQLTHWLQYDSDYPE